MALINSNTSVIVQGVTGILNFWKKVFDFRTTSSRTEYWWGMFNVLLLSQLLGVGVSVFNLDSSAATTLFSIGLLFLGIPLFSLLWRRANDSKITASASVIIIPLILGYMASFIHSYNFSHQDSFFTFGSAMYNLQYDFNMFNIWILPVFALLYVGVYLVGYVASLFGLAESFLASFPMLDNPVLSTTGSFEIILLAVIIGFGVWDSRQES